MLAETVNSSETFENVDINEELNELQEFDAIAAEAEQEAWDFFIRMNEEQAEWAAEAEMGWPT